MILHLNVDRYKKFEILLALIFWADVYEIIGWDILCGIKAQAGISDAIKASENP